MIFGVNAVGTQAKRSVLQQASQLPFNSARWVRRLAATLSVALVALPTGALAQLESGEGGVFNDSQEIAVPAPGADAVQDTPLTLSDLRQSDSFTANRQVAMQLPQATPLAFFISTSDPNWDALKQFALFDQLSSFLGGSLTPTRLGFFPPGLVDAYEYETGGSIKDWLGEASVLSMLPDTTPASITPTDLAATTYMVLPVTDQAALAPFLALLETSRVDAPEKMTYEGTELWVWPTRTETLPDWDEAWEWDEEGAEEGPASPEASPEAAPEVSPEAVPDAVPPAPLGKAAPENPVGLPAPETAAENTYQVPGLTVAMMGDHLVFAQEPVAVKGLIDYHRLDAPRLGESDLFLRSQYAETDGAIAQFYSNLSEVVKFNLDGALPPMSRAGFPLPDDIPLPEGAPPLPDFSAFSLSPDARVAAATLLEGVTMEGLVFPDDLGLRLQGRIYGNELVQSRATPALPYADAALSFVPAPTYSLSSGRNVAGFWQQIATGLSLGEQTRPYLEQARSFVKTLLGLDLDTELLGWMDQEFVLFFFPSNQGAINTVFPGATVEIGVAIQTSDRPTAQKALDAIDGLVGAVPVSVNQTPAVSWQGPNPLDSSLSQPLSYLSHSWVSDDTVIFTTGTGAMARLLNATAFEPINEHPTFLNATGSLARPNDGYAYLNAGSTLSLIYSLINRWVPGATEGFFAQQVQSLLGTVRGFGSSTSATQDYWQLDSVMNLAPAEDFVPLQLRDLALPIPLELELPSEEALDEESLNEGVSNEGVGDEGLSEEIPRVQIRNVPPQ